MVQRWWISRHNTVLLKFMVFPSTAAECQKLVLGWIVDRLA
jgi:hypothetical protein